MPGARPQDPIGATRYDTAKAVFLPRNVYAEDEDIRTGLKNFWNLIKTIRERWKKDSEAVKEAAEAKKDSELPMLKDRVKNQRDMMEAALNTAIEFGHKDLIRAYVFPRLLKPPPALMCTCVSIENALICYPAIKWQQSWRNDHFYCLKTSEQMINNPRLLPTLMHIANCEPTMASMSVRNAYGYNLLAHKLHVNEVLAALQRSTEDGNSDHTLRNHSTRPQTSSYVPR
jgi:predicted CopG family antitoxin